MRQFQYDSEINYLATAPPVSEDRPQNRLLQLDVLRGIAATLVLFFHYTARFDQLYGHAPRIVPFYLGQRGVDLFFVISGFVVFMTIERTRRGLDFAVARFARLYPAYWIAVAITFAAVRAAGLPGREVTLRTAIANLSMMSAFFQIPYVDSVYWTLTLELSFYAIIFILFELQILEQVEIFCCGWLALLLGVHLAALGGRYPLPYLLDLLIMPNYAQLFVAGMILYRIYSRGFTFFRAAILLAAIIAQSCLQGPIAGLFGALSVIAVYAATRGWLRLLEIAPLLFLGGISYSLYLIHQNIGYVVIRAGYTAGINNKLAIALAAAVAILLASAITLVVERPAMRSIRNWYRRIFSASAAVPSRAPSHTRA